MGSPAKGSPPPARLAAGRRRRRPGLALTGRPGRERELDHERDRQLRLRHQHRPRLEDLRPLPLRAGQEAVLATGRLRGIEAADDPDGGVGHDAPLDLAGRLLRADQDHAQRPTTLGHVEQDLLDRAGAVPGRVLVQLVQHHELQRARLTGPLLVVEGLAQHDADDEPLGPVVQVVEVHHRDLPLQHHPMALGVGDVGPDEVLDVGHRAAEAPDEGVDGAGADGRAGPPAGRAVRPRPSGGSAPARPGRGSSAPSRRRCARRRRRRAWPRGAGR